MFERKPVTRRDKSGQKRSARRHSLGAFYEPSPPSKSSDLVVRFPTRLPEGISDVKPAEYLSICLQISPVVRLGRGGPGRVGRAGSDAKIPPPLGSNIVLFSFDAISLQFLLLETKFNLKNNMGIFLESNYNTIKI